MLECVAVIANPGDHMEVAELFMFDYGPQRVRWAAPYVSFWERMLRGDTYNIGAASLDEVLGRRKDEEA